MKSNTKIVKIFLILIIIFMLLCACSGDKEYYEKILPKRIYSYSIEYIKLLNSKNIEEAGKRISNNKISKLTDGDLDRIIKRMPSDEIVKITPIDSMYYKYDEYVEYYTKYGIEYKKEVSQSILLGVIEEKEGLSIVNFEILKRPEPYTYSKESITIRRGVFAFLGLGYILVTLISIWFCINSTIKLKWKLIFLFICLSGLVKFSFNWNTGEIALQFLSIGAAAPIYKYIALSGNSFIILSFYLPIGAIFFLLKKKLILKKFSEPSQGEAA